MKKISFLILIISFCLLLTACGNTEEVTTAVTTTETTTQTTTAATTTEATTVTTTKAATTAATTTEATTAAVKMVCSASADNPYLNAVVQKYGIDPYYLVAYYNDSGNSNGNLVFEFDGTTNSDGRLKRTNDTLKNIYTVDSSYNAKKATGTAAEGNEYSSADSLKCKYFVKLVVFKYSGNDIQNA